MMRDVLRWATIKGDTLITYLLIDQQIFVYQSGTAVRTYDFVNATEVRAAAVTFTEMDEREGFSLTGTVYITRMLVNPGALVINRSKDREPARHAFIAIDECVLRHGEALG